MFFPLSKLLWSAAGLAGCAAFLLGAALTAARRPGRRIVLAAVVLAGVALGALSLPPVANALLDRVTSSGQSTVKPEAVYDVAVTLGGAPTRLLAAAEAVRSGRARYLLYSGRLSKTGVANFTSLAVAHGVPPERITFETGSRNTRENAVESARIIGARGWQSILLVTSASHVERALGCFHRVGLQPDVLAVRDPGRLRHLWPRVAALERSRGALHELVGRIVYRLVGYSE